MFFLACVFSIAVRTIRLKCQGFVRVWCSGGCPARTHIPGAGLNPTSHAGNASLSAEFNFFMDPEAAHIVMHAFSPKDASTPPKVGVPNPLHPKPAMM